jgi:hypothetical protein
LKHVNELVSRGAIIFVKVASKDNVADILTKLLTRAPFRWITSFLLRGPEEHHVSNYLAYSYYVATAKMKI